MAIQQYPTSREPSGRPKELVRATGGKICSFKLAARTDYWFIISLNFQPGPDLVDAIQLSILAAVLVYFLAMIVIGIIASKNQSNQDFIIAGRNVGYLSVIGSLAASFG